MKNEVTEQGEAMEFGTAVGKNPALFSTETPQAFEGRGQTRGRRGGWLDFGEDVRPGGGRRAVQVAGQQGDCRVVEKIDDRHGKAETTQFQGQLGG